MEKRGLDEVFYRCRFNPSPIQAVTYHLPRLISGETLHGAEQLIYHADVYGCEPKDLAARFAPVPQAEHSGDRFFFTLCKRKKGSSTRSARAAGAGSWTIQKTTDIENEAGLKVGEIKKLSFMLKGKVKTDWLMEEYRCCLQEADVVDGVKVLCKIYLSPNASSAARQESAAYARQEGAEPPMPAPAPQPQPVSTHAPKRPAPVDADPPCPKRTRVSVPTPPVVQQPDCAPLPAAFTEGAPAAVEAEDDMDRFACSLDELIGGAAEEEETLPPDEPEQQVVLGSDEFDIPTLDELSVIFNLDDAESFALDDLDMLSADHGEGPEQQAVLASDESSMAAEDAELKELLGRYKPRPIFRLDQLEGHNEFFST